MTVSDTEDDAAPMMASTPCGELTVNGLGGNVGRCIAGVTDDHLDVLAEDTTGLIDLFGS
ncbi:MAG: hypothetical protein V9E82_10220 [Candidatus Nanopelagicales bacterium]